MDKKAIPLYILEVLRDETDDEHGLYLEDIKTLVNKRYGEGTISKRETVLSNIEVINDFYAKYKGIEEYISYTETKDESNSRRKDNKQYYITERQFDLPEIHFLLGVLFSTNDNKAQILRLNEKIMQDLSTYQKKSLGKDRISDGSKQEPIAVTMFNLQMIQEAIVNKQNIRFDYTEYDLNKKLVAKTRDYDYIVSPYSFINSRGNYFLAAFHLPLNEMRVYRIDKIRNLEKLDKKESKYKTPDLDIKAYLNNAAYMHADEKRITVKLRCEKSILDDVIERFSDCRLVADSSSQKHFIATIPNTTHLGMKYWILEFSSACEVLEPQELRRDIKNTLSTALSWYS